MASTAVGQRRVFPPDRSHGLKVAVYVGTGSHSGSRGLCPGCCGIFVSGGEWRAVDTG